MMTFAGYPAPVLVYRRGSSVRPKAQKLRPQHGFFDTRVGLLQGDVVGVEGLSEGLFQAGDGLIKIQVRYHDATP